MAAKKCLPWRRWEEKWSTEERLYWESVRALEVKIVSDRMMYMERDIEGVMMIVVIA